MVSKESLMYLIFISSCLVNFECTTDDKESYLPPKEKQLVWVFLMCNFNHYVLSSVG